MEERKAVFVLGRLLSHGSRVTNLFECRMKVSMLAKTHGKLFFQVVGPRKRRWQPNNRRRANCRQAYKVNKVNALVFSLNPAQTFHKQRVMKKRLFRLGTDESQEHENSSQERNRKQIQGKGCEVAVPTSPNAAKYGIRVFMCSRPE